MYGDNILMTKVTKQSRHLVLILALFKGKINPSGFLIIKDKNYCKLLWKLHILRYYGINCHIVHNNYYYLITKKYKFMRLYYKIILKRFTPKLIERLTILDLAILYNDIGHINYKKNNNKICAITLNLYTKLSNEVNQLLINYIYQKWHIKFYQLKYKTGYKLCCNTKQANQFLSLIHQYIKM